VFAVRRFECSSSSLSNLRHVKVNFRILASGTEVARLYYKLDLVVEFS
jgi:hypothetical protein